MSLPRDPEFRLVAACCGWPPSPARDAAVRAAVCDIDWDRFGRVVARHRVAGLVDAAFRAARVVPPPAPAERIADDARRIARQSLLGAAETVRLTRLIEGAGHDVLALKGAALGLLGYGSVALKHGKDIDLLVLPETVDAIVTLLERDGYRLTSPVARPTVAQRRTLTRYGKDVTLLDEAGHQVELHWRAFDNAALLPGVTARTPAQVVALGGAHRVRTLADAELYAYLVVHGALHGWFRLKWLADVHAWLVRRTSGEVDVLHCAAVAMGAGAASAQALLLLHDLFGLPLPPAATTAPSWRVRCLVAGARRVLMPPDGARELEQWRAGRLRVLAMYPLLQPRWRDTPRAALAMLYPREQLYRSPLPPALYPLYPLLYVPSWLWRVATAR